uniref:Uncharacterized protein n=1 Tax=Rhodnius prolixus TaxID=13249 RepID=T1HRV2_RHOPR
MGTSDAERSGRPVEVTTPEIIDKIHDMVMDDRRVKKTVVLFNQSNTDRYVIIIQQFFLSALQEEEDLDNVWFQPDVFTKPTPPGFSSLMKD